MPRAEGEPVLWIKGAAAARKGVEDRVVGSLALSLALLREIGGSETMDDHTRMCVAYYG